MMRPDAKVEKCTSTPSPSTFESPSMAWPLWSNSISRWRCSTRCFRLPQQAAQPREDRVLGTQRLLPLAQTLGVERFKTSPDVTDEAIVLTVQELNWLLDGFDLWRNRPHQVLTPRFVA